jgi:hypothetical protein
MVWLETTEVGCAATYCEHGLANTGDHISPYFLVCNFLPAGESILDQFVQSYADQHQTRQYRWHMGEERAASRGSAWRDIWAKPIGRVLN